MEFQPHPKNLFPTVLLGLLLAPLMGIGMFLIWLNYEKWTNTVYTISEDSISISEKTSKKTMKKENILEIEVVQGSLQKLLKVADIRIISKKGQIVYQGIEIDSDIYNTLTSLI